MTSPDRDMDSMKLRGTSRNSWQLFPETIPPMNRFQDTGMAPGIECNRGSNSLRKTFSSRKFQPGGGTL